VFLKNLSNGSANVLSPCRINYAAEQYSGSCMTCDGIRRTKPFTEGATSPSFENEGEVDQSDSLIYFPEDHHVLLCTEKPRSSLRIRNHQQNKMREFRKQNGLSAPYSWSED